MVSTPPPSPFAWVITRKPTARNRSPPRGVSAAMPNHRLPLLALSTILLAAACSSGTVPPSGSPSGSPSGGPSPTSAPTEDTGAIDHPTGAKDVILRYDEGPGFMMPAFVVSMVPPFTLYGDGTVVFRPSQDVLPEPVDGVIRNVPLRTARMSEDQIQQLLEFALSEGGLGVAVKDQYDNPMVADAGTAIFTIRAGDVDKTINVYALGQDAPEVPDREIRTKFMRLAERLQAIDQGGAIPTDVYAPQAYRGILMDGAGMQGAAISWPWPNLKVSDFSMAGDEQGPAFPIRSLTPEEVSAIGVPDATGGFHSLLITGPDGKLYSFAARPLLPDEQT
jgi:hypothetical protein